MINPIAKYESCASKREKCLELAKINRKAAEWAISENAPLAAKWYLREAKRLEREAREWEVKMTGMNVERVA